MLAPAQMQRGDMMGAASMLQSSFTLSKGLHDVPTMLTALQGISDHHAKSGEMAQFHDNTRHATTKHAEYVQALQEASQTLLHRKIMQWQGLS